MKKRMMYLTLVVPETGTDAVFLGIKENVHFYLGGGSFRYQLFLLLEKFCLTGQICFYLYFLNDPKLQKNKMYAGCSHRGNMPAMWGYGFFAPKIRSKYCILL